MDAPAATSTPGANGRMCGISYERSQVAVRHVADGLSKVYLVGERYLNSKKYDTGLDVADNEYMFVGFDNDMYKTADWEPAATASCATRPRVRYRTTATAGAVHTPKRFTWSLAMAPFNRFLMKSILSCIGAWQIAATAGR